MKTISNKEYEDYQQYLSDKRHGHILSPDTLRFIIEANDYDAQKIGQYFLGLYPKIREWTERSPHYG